MRVIHATVAILVEVTFPMDLTLSDDGSETDVMDEFAEHLEAHPRQARDMLENRMIDYGEILRVDVR